MPRRGSPPPLADAGPPHREPPARRLLLLPLLLGAVWVLAVPPFMGPDEPWHLERAELMAVGADVEPDGRPTAERLDELAPSGAQLAYRLGNRSAARIRAVQRRLLQSLHEQRWFERVDWAERPGAATSFDLIHEGITAAQQPSAYYRLLGVWLRLCPFEDPAVRVRFARIPSLIAYLLLVAAAWRLGELAGGPHLARRAALAAMLLPPGTRIASTVNNDALAVALVALAVLAAAPAMAGHARTLRSLALLTGLAVAAAFTKGTALGLAVLLPCVWVARSIRTGDGLLVRLRRTPLRFGLLTLLLAAPAAWALRESPTLAADLPTALERLRAGVSPENLFATARSILGPSNWNARDAGATSAIAAAALVAVAGLGLLRLRALPPLGWSCVLLVAVQSTLVAMRGTGTARYLWPAAPAACLLLVWFWSAAFERAEHDGEGSGSVGADLALVVLLVAWQASALIGGVWLEERGVFDA